MKRIAGACFVCVALLAATAGGSPITTEHFRINSTFAPAYIKVVGDSAETYYRYCRQWFFSKGWAQSVTVYYCQNEKQARQLLEDNLHDIEAGERFYVPSVPAIYAYPQTGDGQQQYSVLFEQIARHFIELNSPYAPQWFKEQLAYFLGHHARIVKGKVQLIAVSPQERRTLTAAMDAGKRFSVKRLFVVRDEGFARWEEGHAFTQVFFQWLYDTGNLKSFLAEVARKGFSLDVLEATVKGSFGKINIALKDVLVAAGICDKYLLQAADANSVTERRRALVKVLELKPDCQAARLALAKVYSEQKDYGKCREQLEYILQQPLCPESLGAAWLMANSYYKEKEYAKALGYYKQAWDYAALYPYRYRIAYQIANCNYYLKNRLEAKVWYGRFLESNWEPAKMKQQVAYANKYVNTPG